ncbi:hypothetical protein DRN74_03520 [Candidatus Micrarchaeota archaeon]|nr:MAG: hypothetical protein DRN74_03520 [Candidatus Micrarchaeota archaeon]
MDIAIVEYGADLSDFFIKRVEEKIADVSYVKKKALDLLDCLAFLKQLSSHEHLILIAEIERSETEKIDAFYQGLAVLEAETGKNIFKYFYESDEWSEEGIKNFADMFIDYVFHPEKLKEEEKKEEELFPDLEPPEPSV